MNLSQVCAELADRAKLIDGLSCLPYPQGTVTPPALVLLNPTPGNLVYDATYGRGMDRMTLPVIVVAGRSNDLAAHEAIRGYLDGSGPRSIKQVLESGTYTSLHTIRVSTGGVDGVVMAGVEYLAGLLELDIAGQGSA